MSDKKISNLNELATALSGDLIPIVDSTTNETKFIQKGNLIEPASFIENIVFKTNSDTVLDVDKINWVTLSSDHTITIPTPNSSNLGKTLIINNRSNYNLTITGSTDISLSLNGVESIVGVVCVTDGVSYGWEVFSYYNKSDFDDLNNKLDLDGGNANQDIDIGNYSLNAKHVKINGTAGSGHIGLKHQSSNITASASESSIGANSVGNPVWKNDGNAIDELELVSRKTNTVTGNEASTTKYLSVKGVYDWVIGLFAPIASPTFTGTVTTPDLLVSNATASTPTFFDATKKLITTTAQLWGTWVQTWSNKATPVDADTIGFHDSASTFVGVKSTLLNFWNAYLLPKVQALGYLTGSGLTANYIPYWNGTNMINSIFQANTSNLVGNNNYSILNSGTGGIINIGTTGTSTAYVQLFSSQYIVIQGTLGNSLYGTTNIQTSGGANRWAFNPSSASLTMSNTSNVVHSFWNSAGLNIGGNGASVSAILQLDSTTKGFLPPRMTSAQKEAIANVEGLVVFDTDLNALCTNDGVSWTTLGFGSGTTTSSATPTIDTDSINYYELTAQAVNITSFTTNLTGTPKRGQKLWIDITGTAARAITWGASFESSTIALPTTTVTTNKLSVGFIWNVATSKWRCIGSC